MAGAFKVLEEFQDDALTLPVKLPDGTVHEFRIPSPSAEDGLRVQKLMEQGARMADSGKPMDTEILDDAEELDLFQTALGPAYDDLMGAGLDWSRVRHIAMTAVMWITAGLEIAEQYWEAQGDPSRVAPKNRAARRAAATSAAASSTKRRGSTSGTSARKATGRARKAAKT